MISWSKKDLKNFLGFHFQLWYICGITRPLSMLSSALFTLKTSHFCQHTTSPLSKDHLIITTIFLCKKPGRSGQVLLYQLFFHHRIDLSTYSRYCPLKARVGKLHKNIPYYLPRCKERMLLFAHCSIKGTCNDQRNYYATPLMCTSEHKRN